MEWLRQTESQCVRHGNERYIRFQAVQSLVAAMLACGDEVGTAHARAQMDALWPDPDPTHLLLQATPEIRCGPHDVP